MHVFDWYHNQRPWMTLTSRYTLYCTNCVFLTSPG